MSPLVWDLGHIAAFEDLWLAHRHGGRPLLREDLADVYDAFETPRAGRGDLPFLRPDDARDYLRDVRERVLDVIADQGVGDGVIAELIVRHEQQHNETMLQTIQLAQLEGLSLNGGGAANAGVPGNGAAAGVALPAWRWWRSPAASASSALRPRASPTTTSGRAIAPTSAGT